jgi:hypothetical protein
MHYISWRIEKRKRGIGTGLKNYGPDQNGGLKREGTNHHVDR